MFLPQYNARLLFALAAVAFASLLGAGGCPRPPAGLDPPDPNSAIAGIIESSGGGAIMLPPGSLDGDETSVDGDETSGDGDGSGPGTAPGGTKGSVPDSPTTSGGASNGDPADGEPPVVDDLGVLTPPDTPIDIELSGASPSGLPLEFAIVAAPVNGSVSKIQPIDDLAASVTFTPRAGFQGQAQFSYEASDGINESNVGTVVVLVYPPVYFALDIYEGDAPLTVVGHAFTMDGASLPDGEYRWNWGDLEEGGPVATFGERAHTFVKSGTYSVGLSIVLAGLAQPIACTHSQRGMDPQFAKVEVQPTIGGLVRDDGGTPLAGVTVATNDGIQTTSDSYGRYILRVPHRWSGTVTPSLDGYEFSPPSRAYVLVTETQSDENYVGPVSSLPGVLSVSPADGLESAGYVGGPFTPDSTEYTLTNVGESPLTWTAVATQGWVTLSSTGGALAAGAAASVTVSINDNANNLDAGSYSDTVTFTNATNGQGNTTRTISLTVLEPATLVVLPSSGLSSYGNVGGPFDPSSKDYTLTNTGSASLDWAVTKTQAWVALSSASGALAPGDSTIVTVSINPEANSLEVGAYSDLVTFTNATNGHGTTSRGVTLTVSDGPQMASSISQYGITWTFDQPYQVGQFVNGDWWVCPDTPAGAVTVVSVDPAPTGSGTTARHGSMINPVMGQYQAYDGRGFYYDGSLAVQYPVTLQPDQSLMSTESRPDNDPDRLNLVETLMPLSKVKLIRASVLTCVIAPQASSAFRPPYAGTNKPIYDSSYLHRELLPALTPAGGSPSFSKPTGMTVAQRYARYFERPWIVHQMADWGEHIRPLDNCLNYYSTAHVMESDAALILCCNYPDKEQLLINFVQYGIDSYYCIQTNPNPPTRGDRCLSKWPLIFAGIMLDDENMRSHHNYAWFKTDACTYAGTGWTGATALWCMERAPTTDTHDQINPFTGDWCQTDSEGNPFWKDEAYRRATHGWCHVGTALAARLMNAVSIWNHDPFFAYEDRWMDVADDSNYDALNAMGMSNPCGDGNYGMLYQQGQVPGNSFTNNMWAAYR